MKRDMYSDDKLNLFIDEQLDFDEMDEMHQAVLKDSDLGTRVCQLKAVRELVRYAYESTPVPTSEKNNSLDRRKTNRFMWQSIAASLFMVVGVTTGWVSNNYAQTGQVVSAAEVFDYFKYQGAVDRSERKIVVHVTTGDVVAVNAALDEVEQLLSSYSDANSPMQLDIVTFRDGINMLRVDGSPYVSRIDSLLEGNSNVALYACLNSINKAKQKWGENVTLMPQTITTRTAKDLISERIKNGWVYIKV